MAVPQKNGSVARFGVFELDFTSGELRKGGVRLRLQGQPYQVLVVLLEHAGQLVTRDELRQELWPSDTFVDFDHSLNTAINKVREVLGDSASNPRYVETLARRGYRFIAPVQGMEPEAPSGADAAKATPSPGFQFGDPVTGAGPIHPELQIPIPNRKITRTLFALIQVMYLAFYLVALFRLRAIDAIADSFLPPWGAVALVGTVLVTAGVGIPLRLYLLSAVAFDHRQLAQKFRRIFPFMLALDEIWAVAPFLLIRKLGPGGAFAVCAALIYLPFSERTLIRMAYADFRENQTDNPGTNLT